MSSATRQSSFAGLPRPSQGRSVYRSRAPCQLRALLLLTTVICSLGGILLDLGSAAAEPGTARAGATGLTGHLQGSARFASSDAPHLGTPWHGLPGFGRERPNLISFGGDPTSEVVHVRWSHWGGQEAVGVGQSDWVWPGTCTGCNPPAAVRVVAFHLGTCHGHRSYNAFEWYFPEYGQTFKPGDYTNPCTHRSLARERPATAVSCADTSLNQGGNVTEVMVQGVSCEAAYGLIRESPLGPYEHERRWELSGFRCGTEGAFGGYPITNIVECAEGEDTVTYTASY
jgi:hypothetical protein